MTNKMICAIITILNAIMNQLILNVNVVVTELLKKTICATVVRINQTNKIMKSKITCCHGNYKYC